MRAEQLGSGDRGPESRSAGGVLPDDATRSEASEFLESVVWALDGLMRHAQRRGHGALAQRLASASDQARADLEAARPRPAEVASARMRALWAKEGRGAGLRA